MKKKLALLLAALFTLLALAPGCQTEKEETAPSSSQTAQEGSSQEEEQDGVTLCIEQGFKQDASDVISFLQAQGDTTQYQLEILPAEEARRETELTRLRTEIMAGEGPDAFVLNTYMPGVLDPLETLFPNVEKSMASHLFLDLEDMVQESELIDLEHCNQAVMDAGVNEDGRFVLPLLYHFSGVVLDCSFLQDPGFTFSSLDELLQSGEDALLDVFSRSGYTIFPNALGQMADYQGMNLLFTQEELLQTTQQADALYAGMTDYGMTTGAQNLGYPGRFTLETLRMAEYADTPYAFFPVPDREGNVTPGVTLWAAVNRNAAHPQEAFTFLEQLFRTEFFNQEGIKVGERWYGNLLTYGSYLGFPVKDESYFQSIEEDVNPQTMASLRAAVARIHSAKIYSDLDKEVYDMYDTWKYGPPEDSLEERVERTYSTLEMTLAE